MLQCTDRLFVSLHGKDTKDDRERERECVCVCVKIKSVQCIHDDTFNSRSERDEEHTLSTCIQVIAALIDDVCTHIHSHCHLQSIHRLHPLIQHNSSIINQHMKWHLHLFKKDLDRSMN